MTDEQAILIAADSIDTLRECDVYRVLENAPKSNRLSVAQYIARKRPELESEAKASWVELEYQ